MALFDFSRKIQGDTDAGMLVLEHVDNLPVEDFLFQERREDQAVRVDNADWQSIIFSALTHGQHTYAKSELMKRAYMLSEMDVAQIFQTIPKTIKCSELISLFSDLIPIFIRLYPLNIRRLLPTWIVDKVSLFETSDPNGWPRDCVQLIELVESNLQVQEEFQEQETKRPSIRILSELKSCMVNLLQLEEKYNLKISFENLNEYKSQPRWQLALVEDKLSTCQQSDLEQMLNNFVIPFLQVNCIDSDPVIIKELESDRWSVDSKLSLIKVLSDTEKQKKFALKILQSSSKPLPSSIVAFCATICS